MIKITSFYPFSGFSRVTNEFSKNKILTRHKSLWNEHSIETPCKDVTKILEVEYRDTGQIFYGLTITMIIGLLYSFDALNNPILLIMARILFSAGLILFLFGFNKNRSYLLYNKSEVVVAKIRVNNKDKRLISDALKLIRLKSKNVAETYMPFTVQNRRPILEFVEYDLPDFVNKSVTRFYATQFSDHNKSLQMETLSEFRYAELSGAIQRERKINGNWLSAGIYILLFGFTVFSAACWVYPVAGDVFVFFRTISYALYILGCFAIVLWLLIREERVYFKKKNDEFIYYSIIVTRKNKEEVEKIIDLIQHKVASKKSSIPQKNKKQEKNKNQVRTK